MDPNDECAISATNMINDLQAEVARLTADRDEAIADHKTEADQSWEIRKERDKANTEVERLRRKPTRTCGKWCLDRETEQTAEIARLREVLACIYRQVARPVGLMERIWFLFTGRFLAQEPTDA